MIFSTINLNKQDWQFLSEHTFLLDLFVMDCIQLKWMVGFIIADQFHNKMTDRVQIMINMPDVNSSKYKAHFRDIQESVRALNNFTNNLEDKVSTMLKGQQTEFVNSYKNHMNTVEQALKDYEQRIADYQKKVEYYENEGALATLIKKIQFLEAHQKKLLDKMSKKDRIIFDLKSQISTQNMEIKSLHQRIKQLLKGNESVRKMKETVFRQQKQSERTFATQIPTTEKSILKSNQSIERINSTQIKYNTITNPQTHKEWKDELSRARNQIENMKKRNRQLSSVNSRIIDKVGETDQFFMRVLNQLKRKITVRKQFKECTFQDFKQQDKLQLLVKILSNDQILQHLYQKIFHKQTFLPLSGMACQSVDISARHLLPAIGTGRRP